MKTDAKGRSTCAAGHEQYEEFYSSINGKNMVQYDYRTTNGELFSCIALSLEAARARRDRWLLSRGMAAAS